MPTMRVQRQQTPLFFLSTAALLLLLLLPAADSLVVGRTPPTETETSFIQKCCNHTDTPRACEISLLPYAGFIQENEGRLVRVAIAVSLSRTRVQASYFSRLFEKAHQRMQPIEASALQDCISVFADSVDSLSDSLNQALHLSTATGKELEMKIADVKTWLSAVLTDADTCTDEFGGLPPGPIVADVMDRVKRAEVLMVNALALFENYADHLKPQKTPSI